MVEAASRVRTLEQQATKLAGAFAATMKPLESRRCYTCGQQGHLSYQCNKGQGRWQSGPQGGLYARNAPTLLQRTSLCQSVSITL